MTSKPTIILVPGTWHLPSTFDLLIPLLTTAGYPTATVKLPSVAATNPITFADDASAVRKAVSDLIDQGREVVVVGHSYGAAPATEALDGLGQRDQSALGLKGGVIQIIYIAGGVSTKGRSAMDAFETNDSKPGGGDWVEFIDLGGGFTAVGNGEECFYNDLPPEEAKYHASRLQRQYQPVTMEPLTYEAYRDIPAAFMYCEYDQAFPIDHQRMAVQAAGIERTTVLKTGHSPFLSHPGAVLTYIEELLRGKN